MARRTDGESRDSTGDKVDLAELEDLAELPDEAAAAAFSSLPPRPSPTAEAGGAGPNWAQRTSSGHDALQAQSKRARLATSAPVLPGIFPMHDPASAQPAPAASEGAQAISLLTSCAELMANREAAPPGPSAPVHSGGVFTHVFTQSIPGSPFTPRSMPLPRAQAAPEMVAAADKHQMVASRLQQQRSPGAAALAEGAYPSMMMPEAAQQHQFVPNPAQYNAYKSTPVPHSAVSQQPCVKLEAMQQQEQLGFVPDHSMQYGSSTSSQMPAARRPVMPEAMPQQQFVPNPSMRYGSSASSASSQMLAAQQPPVMLEAMRQQQQFVPNPMQYGSSASQMPMAHHASVTPAMRQQFVEQQQFVTLQQRCLWQQSQLGQPSQFVSAAALQYNSPSLMSMAQRPTPAVHAYAQAQYAAPISDAASAGFEAQNLLPSSLQEIFETCVMCDYTPRVPKHFPTSRWATLEELVLKLEKHAPKEVQKLGHQKLRQMITEWYKEHPNYRDLPYSAWGKRLKDKSPDAQPRALIFKFCFEHTPEGRGPSRGVE